MSGDVEGQMWDAWESLLRTKNNISNIGIDEGAFQSANILAQNILDELLPRLLNDTLLQDCCNLERNEAYFLEDVLQHTWARKDSSEIQNQNSLHNTTDRMICSANLSFKDEENTYDLLINFAWDMSNNSPESVNFAFNYSDINDRPLSSFLLQIKFSDGDGDGDGDGNDDKAFLGEFSNEDIVTKRTYHEGIKIVYEIAGPKHIKPIRLDCTYLGSVRALGKKYKVWAYQDMF